MSKLVKSAINISENAHAGQLRKWQRGDVPYFKHPERVALKVESLPDMTDVDVAAAYLHDVEEDCDPKWVEEIRMQCGEEVLALVHELTFTTEGPEWLQRSRAEKNVIRNEHMAKMTNRAKRIKLVDRWDNLLDMEYAPFKLKQKYIPESLKLVEIIGHADAQMAKEVLAAVEHVKKSISK
jgi:(p)ppGpp synthase/HD superfamily hydrolase